MSIITPRDITEESSDIIEQQSTISNLSASTFSSNPHSTIQPVLPILKFSHSICPHGSPITINPFRRQYHGCRRCYLVGSLINSIECGNALGSIALISRNEQSDLIETKCNAKNGITALGAACASNDVEAMKRLM